MLLGGVDAAHQRAGASPAPTKSAARTVRNALTELSVSGRLPIIQERKRWRLAPDARIETPPVRFMLEEAAAVYLAARLLCRHSDDPNPAVRRAAGLLPGQHDRSRPAGGRPLHRNLRP